MPPTITPADSPAPALSTPLPTATEILGPIEYTIQAGDDCFSVAYNTGHNDIAVFDLILKMNNLSSCRMLPGPGSVILVPRPTFTPTPAGLDLTQTAIATSLPPMVTLNAPASYSVQGYTVQEGDTLMSIALSHDTSMRQICELNQGTGANNVDCRGCTWESANCCCPSNVAPVLSVGQQLNVPAPTPTPTLTPTFTGSETPTMTPTHLAPEQVYPTAGASVAGPVRFAWLTVGILAEDEYYLVMVHDDTTGASYNDRTRQLSFDLPQAYLPVDGQAHAFTWQVSVVRLGSDGLLYPVGANTLARQFTWSGWQQQGQ
jgi:hypothetical protein